MAFKEIIFDALRNLFFTQAEFNNFCADKTNLYYAGYEKRMQEESDIRALGEREVSIRLLGCMVAYFPNEWTDPHVGIVRCYYNHPKMGEVVVFNDIVTGIEVTYWASSVRFIESRTILQTLLTLSPYERWNLFAKCSSIMKPYCGHDYNEACRLAVMDKFKPVFDILS